jgi:hypothetical protein
MQNNKTLFLWILMALTAILSIGLVMQIQSSSNIKDELRRKEVAYAALTTEVKVLKDKDGKDVFQKSVPEITPKDIMESPIYKQLDVKTQQYYKELSKQKGLLASAQAEIKVLKKVRIPVYVEPADQSDSTITFVKGSTAEFSDTTGALKWAGVLTIDSPLTLDLTTEYNPTIQTDFIRQKDKSIVVNIKIDDPDVTVTKVNSIVIPAEKKTGIQKALNWAVKIGILAGGFYLGSR